MGGECQVGVRTGVNLSRRLQLEVPLDWHCIIKSNCEKFVISFEFFIAGYC